MLFVVAPAGGLQDPASGRYYALDKDGFGLRGLDRIRQICRSPITVLFTNVVDGLGHTHLYGQGCYVRKRRQSIWCFFTL